jgi:hypothetical protein
MVAPTTLTGASCATFPPAPRHKNIAIVCKEHGGERARHEKAPANGSGIRNVQRFLADIP